MQYTKNLDGYMKMRETNSCYLDGRYFAKVLSSYPGFLPNDLHIFIRNKKATAIFPQREIFSVQMKENNINQDYPGLLKLVITTPESRHSNLLILDYSAGIVHRFEPLGIQAPFFNKVNQILESYLSLFLDIEVKVIDVDLNAILDDTFVNSSSSSSLKKKKNLQKHVLNEKNPNCVRRNNRSGFCTAYILLYAYCYLNGKEFDPTEIRRFAKMIETTYGPLPMEGKEEEYGLWGNDNPNQNRNILVGSGLGALGGAALIGGPVGILGGTLLGGGLGSTF
jgi:hypothetical protein